MFDTLTSITSIRQARLGLEPATRHFDFRHPLSNAQLELERHERELDIANKGG
jgi:hypothetical protein